MFHGDADRVHAISKDVKFMTPSEWGMGSLTSLILLYVWLASVYDDILMS